MNNPPQHKEEWEIGFDKTVKELRELALKIQGLQRSPNFSTSDRVAIDNLSRIFNDKITDIKPFIRTLLVEAEQRGRDKASDYITENLLGDGSTQDFLKNLGRYSEILEAAKSN